MVAPTDLQLFANNVTAHLDAEVTAIATAIALISGDGDDFPEPEANEFFAITLHNLSTGESEICYCTSRSGDTLTVERAQEDTTALVFPVEGTIVQMRLTAGALDRIRDNAGADGIQSVVAGDNVTVDNTDPQNPIVSAEAGGGGAGVELHMWAEADPAQENALDSWSQGAQVDLPAADWLEPSVFEFEAGGSLHAFNHATVTLDWGIWASDSQMVSLPVPVGDGIDTPCRYRVKLTATRLTQIGSNVHLVGAVEVFFGDDFQAVVPINDVVSGSQADNFYLSMALDGGTADVTDRYVIARIFKNVNPADPGT